jgi:FkbM family methyltransferase
MRELAFRALQGLIGVLRPWEGAVKRVPGALPLFDRVYRRLRPHGLARVEIAGGHLWIDPGDEGVGRALLVRRSHEEPETVLLRQVLQPGMTVVDVGANIGYFTILASRLVGPSGRVVAFEPAPAALALLRRNLEENGCSNVRLVPRAVGARGGDATLFTTSDNLGVSSLLSANVPGSAVMGATVAMTTLDADLEGERVDLVKIDVQGAESAVIAGGGAVLARPGVRLLLELWPPGLAGAGTPAAELLADLEARGFVLHLVEHPLRAIGIAEALAAAEGHPDGFVNLYLTR